MAGHQPSGVQGLLRRAVLDHVTAETRRVFPPVAHAGRPGAHVVRLVLDGPPPDQALCADALAAMLRRVGRGCPEGAPLVWLTRPGLLDVQDVDLTWSTATRVAALELGTDLDMVVVTRQGWRDPRTGEGRTWRRLRPARRPG